MIVSPFLIAGTLMMLSTEEALSKATRVLFAFGGVVTLIGAFVNLVAA